MNLNAVSQLVEFLIADALLCLIVWVKVHDAEKLTAGRLKSAMKVIAEIVLSFIVVSAVLDPLVPGYPVLTIRIPVSATVPLGMLENLQARITPVGLQGTAGGSRIVYAPFDRDGVAEVVSELTMFETRVTVEIFDVTQPSQTIKSTTVYISPFVKRQLTTKTISF